MANSKFLEFWDGLPPWAKGVALVGTLGVLTVVGFKINTAIKNKAAEKSNAQTTSDAQQDSAKLTAQGINPSFLGSQYASWSDQLQEAMNSCGQDGWEQDVLNIFKQLLNTQDVLMLISAFGVRTLNPCWYSHPVNTFESFFSSSSFKGNLNWWLQQCLSTTDFDTVNSYLSAQGINYTFQ